MNRLTTLDGDAVEWTTTGAGTEFTIVVDETSIKLSMLHADRLASTIKDAVSLVIKNSY